MRVAALDLGTNTTRLLVADVVDGRVAEVSRRTTITRLGEGVDSRRRLLPLPIARVRNCLSDYRRELESLGAERALLVATSAVRDAENGEAFLGEIEWSYGFTTRLLTGEEEAEMTLRGVGDAGADALVVDIGGGSTELIGDGHPRQPRPRLRAHDRALPPLRPAAEDELDALAPRASRLAERCRTLTPARGDRRGRHGHVARRSRPRPGRVRPRARRTATGSGRGGRRAARAARRAPARRAAPGAGARAGAGSGDRRRARSIVREVLRHFGLDAIEASERDILHGVALAAAELPEPVEGDAPPGAYTCC